MVVGVLGLPVRAGANPIPCDSLTVARSGDDVVITVEFDKVCYEAAPELGDAAIRRDLFPLELSPEAGETTDSFTLTATDVGVSRHRHLHQAKLAEGLILAADLPEAECGILTAVPGEGGIDLTVEIDRECLVSPLPEREYRATHNDDPLALTFDETVEAEVIRATATDDDVVGTSHHYLVGVRAGDDTVIATADPLLEGRPDAGPGPDPADAGTSVDATGSAGEGDGGCAATRGGTGWLVLALCAGFPIARRRRS
jgi:hypothetical protein